MKMITFEHAGRMSYGAVKGERVVDLGNRLGRDAPTLLDLIANEVETRARGVVGREPGDLALADIRLERPLPAPGKILCIGVNFQDRNAEYRDGSDMPKYPSLFVRFPDPSWRTASR